jgi:transcriptional regulator with XRE-family HTH domain
MEENINERIRTIILKFCDGKNSVFAEKVGTSKANVSNYIRNTRPKQEVIQRIVDCFDIDIVWLMTGRGSMLKPTEPDKTPEDIQKIPLTGTGKSTTEQYLIDTIKEQAEEIGRLKAFVEFIKKSREGNL